MRNKLDGKPLGDGVLLAAGIGGAFGALGAPGVGKFMGKVASRTGSGLSKVAGKVFSRGGKVCALSFSSDTAVTTPDGGQQAIATLEEGDAIVAYDPETGEASTQTVEHVWINHDDDLIDLTLRPDAQGQAQAGDGTRKQQDAAVASHGMRAPPQNVQAKTPIAADTGNETVHTTAKHPGQSRGERGWVQAGALQVGQRVVRLDGSTATITSVRVVPGAATMYNLTVSFLHTFAVGDGQYVVHNRCGGQVTDEDLYAFGGSPNGPNPGPRGARPGTDIPVKNGMVPRQRALQPKGISTYNDPHRAPLTGHYYRLPAGTRLPRGMRYIADGEDVGGRQPWGHRTFYPTRNMPFDEFNSGFRNLPWQYGGKR